MYKGLGIKLNNIPGDIWCEFEETITFMKRGQFNACSKAISRIREKMTFKPNNYNVLLDWTLQINSYVCQKFQQRVSDSEGSYVDAEVLLQNIQGISPTMATLEMELMLIYNSSFDVIGNRRNAAGSVSRLLSSIERSLFRLSSFLQVQESEVLVQQNSLFPVLKAILLRKEAFTGSLLKVFGLICCIISWLLLIRTQHREALAVMKLFHSSCDGCPDIVETIEDDIIEPEACSSSPNLCARDFLHLTNAYCLVFCGENSEALSCLKKISEEEWHSRIQYISASVMLSSEQVDEPFAITKSLLSSGMPSLPSLWKSRVFNLIGCCLVHKKKPYSAVECFRKSLNYNPSQVLPLLNITCVYRSLGFWEAELKALRILLQEIQDREVREMGTGNVQDPLPLVEELTITKADVLYVLAKRLQETGSFPQSVATYEQLLQHLKTTLRHESVLLPSAPELYKDAICATYLASLHSPCLELCKRAEEDCPEAFRDADVALMSSLDSADLDLNKGLELKDPLFEGPCARRRTRSTDPRVFGFTVSLLKALSCESLGRHQEALDALQIMKRVLSLANVCGESFPVKRARLEGDSFSSQEEEKRNGWKVLSSTIYSCLGALHLQSQTPAEDVAYFLHSAILSWPENVEAYFHYAKLLLREGREDDAQKTWAQVRPRLPVQAESDCPTSFLTITREQLCLLDRHLTPPNLP